MGTKRTNLGKKRKLEDISWVTDGKMDQKCQLEIVAKIDKADEQMKSSNLGFVFELENK